MRTGAIYAFVLVISRTVFQSKCGIDIGQIELDSDEDLWGKRPKKQHYTYESTETSVPKEGVSFKYKYITTIFDDDFGMNFVADWSRSNGVRCDYENDQENFDLANRVCKNGCRNNYTILTTGMCLDGWVTCLIGFNENGHLNMNMHCKTRNRQTGDDDTCVEFCFWACQKNSLPTAAVRPYWIKGASARRGCSRGRCTCAPFNEEFRHPIPSLHSGDIAEYIEKSNATYYEKERRYKEKYGRK